MIDTDTKYKAVDYIETYTGGKFFPLRPDPKDVSIIDIAHHLSNQCRYSGATDVFYSTAQHSCILASYAENVLHASALDCLQILIHDAAEAYLVDIPRPVKQFMPEYRTWDRLIQIAVRAALGLTDVPVPAWQDEIDSGVVNDERAQLMSDSGNDWMHTAKPLKVAVDPWAAATAEKQFLFRFAAYYIGAFDKPAYLDAKWGMTGDHLRATYSDGGHPEIEDLVEVDLLGGVGRVKLRSENGMLIRDTNAGRFVRPATKWVRGKFDLILPPEVMADVV